MSKLTLISILLLFVVLINAQPKSQRHFKPNLSILKEVSITGKVIDK